MHKAPSPFMRRDHLHRHVLNQPGPPPRPQGQQGTRCGSRVCRPRTAPLRLRQREKNQNDLVSGQDPRQLSPRDSTYSKAQRTRRVSKSDCNVHSCSPASFLSLPPRLHNTPRESRAKMHPLLSFRGEQHSVLCKTFCSSALKTRRAYVACAHSCNICFYM